MIWPRDEEDWRCGGVVEETDEIGVVDTELSLCLRVNCNGVCGGDSFFCLSSFGSESSDCELDDRDRGSGDNEVGDDNDNDWKESVIELMFFGSFDKWLLCFVGVFFLFFFINESDSIHRKLNPYKWLINQIIEYTID